ncbi:hypothetical protein [Persephonella sp.]
MKKLVLVITAFLYAFNLSWAEIDRATRYEIRILEKLVIDITGKRHPSVYFDGISRNKIRIIKKYSKLKEAKDGKDADFVFVKNKKKPFNVDKPTLALDFGSLKYCRYCIGVFSWKNGRPMLILFKENLKRFGIHLPEEYRYFIESKSYTVGKR